MLLAVGSCHLRSIATSWLAPIAQGVTETFIPQTVRKKLWVLSQVRGSNCFLEEWTNSCRWSFRQVQGSHRRLFPVTGEGPQGGDRYCQRVPDAEIWADRRSPPCGRAVFTHATLFFVLAVSLSAEAVLDWDISKGLNVIGTIQPRVDSRLVRIS